MALVAVVVVIGIVQTSAASLRRRRQGKYRPTFSKSSRFGRLIATERVFCYVATKSRLN